MSKMGRNEVISIIMIGARQYLTYLRQVREMGPEGIEVYINQIIEPLENAIEVIEHG
jgi:hypothetical protein